MLCTTTFLLKKNIIKTFNNLSSHPQAKAPLGKFRRNFSRGLNFGFRLFQDKWNIVPFPRRTRTPRLGKGETLPAPRAESAPDSAESKFPRTGRHKTPPPLTRSPSPRRGDNICLLKKQKKYTIMLLQSELSHYNDL